jgi:hypothetical protein
MEIHSYENGFSTVRGIASHAAKHHFACAVSLFETRGPFTVLSLNERHDPPLWISSTDMGENARQYETKELMDIYGVDEAEAQRYVPTKDTFHKFYTAYSYLAWRRTGEALDEAGIRYMDVQGNNLEKVFPAFGTSDLSGAMKAMKLDSGRPGAGSADLPKS